MGSNNLLMLVLYAAAFIAIFYFLLIRPQQRQRRAHEAMVSSVKPGDKVVTAGGIHGTVKRTESDTITLTVAKGVDIKIARRAISEIGREGTAASAEAAKQAAPKELEEPLDTPAESGTETGGAEPEEDTPPRT